MSRGTSALLRGMLALAPLGAWAQAQPPAAPVPAAPAVAPAAPPAPAIALPAAAAPAAATAPDANLQVELKSLVILASMQGNEVDPRVTEVMEDLKANGVGFTSYKVLSTPVATLAMKGTTKVDLPNGGALTFKLVKKDKDGKIRITAEVPKKLKTTYSIVDKGTQILMMSEHRGDKLIIAVTHTLK